jgi:3-dehydroquinate synthase class II
MKIAISELEHLREEIKNCHQIIKDFQMKREWVGLTDEEITEIYEMGLGVRASVETALDKIEERNNG